MRTLRMVAVAAAGFTLAALTGLAIGKSHTLSVQPGVKNTRNGGAVESVVVAHGLAVYYLGGETKTHALCTKANGCFAVWKPVKAPAHGKPTKGAGVNGTAGVWKRGKLRQVTLAGHPLYTYIQDTHGVAMGDKLQSFGGTWHLVKAASAGGGTTTTMTTTTTTTTTPCLYPPYC